MTQTISREQRMAEKKAAAEAKKQSNLRVLARAHFKATGAVLIGIEDRNGKHAETFHVTIIAGKITGCHNAATGEECSGRYWAGHCCHEARVLSYEARRAEELAGTAQVASVDLAEMVQDDMSAHVEDSIRAGDFEVGTCAQCSNPVKTGFALCPWCEGVAA